MGRDERHHDRLSGLRALADERDRPGEELVLAAQQLHEGIELGLFDLTPNVNLRRAEAGEPLSNGQELPDLGLEQERVNGRLSLGGDPKPAPPVS